MLTVSIGTLLLPFVLGFLIFLLPRFHKLLSLAVPLATAAFALLLFTLREPFSFLLLDNFGVTLLVDQLGAFFFLTNAVVSLAVLSYVWQKNFTYFFYAMLLFVHGSVNAAFLCTDFMSLYVALEVSGIAAFLLIAYPRTDRTIWVALRYLCVSNIAMLFYLVGAVLAYKANHSFAYESLRGAPPEAVALIVMGLLVKGGVFVSGLWLPVTHSEADTPVSAMLSGIVVKAGVFPLLRCAILIDELDPIIRTFGVATALLGVSYAVFEKDSKRMLAFHTVSQLGFVMAAPAVGGFYALTHGLVKSALFLMAGSLPSRNFKELQKKSIRPSIWVALTIASLSISGAPLLAGYGAKVLTLKEVWSWQAIALNLAAVGTAISFAKFIFLPRSPEAEEHKPGIWAAVTLLLSGLVIANMVYLDAYSLDSLLKAVGTIALGWAAYWVFFRRADIKLPRLLEEFENLVGVMGLMLILIFWMALA
ncbi:MAG: cation:proton antiporter [Oculatellaceae cyanobacterium Prado106]|nr:cation:proton antiporter [Oculatellaceae cyanobacterium Prado106]